MKIAYVLNTYPQPSHSFIRREIQALERLGFDVVRLAMRRGDTTLVDVRDQEEATRTDYVLDRGGLGLLSDVFLVGLRSPRRLFKACALAWHMGRASPSGVLRHLIYLAEAAHVARRCKTQGITHVHAHFGTNATAVALLSDALGGCRYSFTVHGPEEFDSVHGLSLAKKLERASFAVGVSQFGRSQLCRWAPFDAWPRLKVVHCGIERTAFGAYVPMPEGPLRLVTIGRFVEQKGQMVLVNALARLQSIHPQVRITLVGDGEMRTDLESAVMDAGLGEMVRFAGWLDQEGVRREIDAAHALVMPSFAEGLPMVIMEAMAAARPVIATQIAGIPELVEQGRSGWLVPAGDASALAEVIALVAEKSIDDIAEMGQAARTRVLERHDIDDQARKLAEFIRNEL